MVAAVLSHVPGGYGVFDVLIVGFLQKEHGPAVVAALLVFRVIYDWLPLLIAAAMLGRNEWSSIATQKTPVAKIFRQRPSEALPGKGKRPRNGIAHNK